MFYQKRGVSYMLEEVIKLIMEADQETLDLMLEFISQTTEEKR